MFDINQSGLRKVDSWINQPIAISHEISHLFDLNPSLETCGVFLDITKDRAWHNGIIFKLKSNRVTGKILKLIEHFLSNRYPRVVLNGQSSSWTKIKGGVPQGSILGGPFVYNVY